MLLDKKGYQVSEKVHMTTISIGKPAGLLRELSMLIKLRLTSVVVISSGLSYLIASQGSYDLYTLALLLGGGFLITSASNILNEVLEKDFDRLMKRTSQRPLASGRMNTSFAVLLAGVSACVGMLLLASLHPLAAMLGSLALVSYAFIYTPLKRFSLWAVPIGAVPGAMPVLIGAVVAQGGLTPLAIVLFSIQFLWQFPHFWAIGWLGFDEYKRAGFGFIPEKNGQVDPRIALHAMGYALALIPAVMAPFFMGMNLLTTGLLLMILTLAFALLAWRLYVNQTRKEALALMFGSLIYLPVVLCLIWIG